MTLDVLRRSLPRLLKVAGEHFVTPSLARGLAPLRFTQRIDADLVEYVEAVHRLNRDRNDRLMGQVRRLTEILDKRGIEPVFLKGIALLLKGVHPDGGARFIRDIDVLLPADRLNDAAAALVGDGWRVLSAAPNMHDAYRLAHPEVPGYVELHRAPLPTKRLGAIVPAERILACAEPVASMSGARVPGPVDLVLHNAAHAMLHDGFYARAQLPLRDACDLALLARGCADRLDWDEIRGAMAEHPTGPSALAFYVNAARAVFGDGVPKFGWTPEARITALRWRLSPCRIAHGAQKGGLRERAWRVLTVPDARRGLSAPGCARLRCSAKG